ncbi:hypothetical protein [Leucobacter sp. G161]|uniref:hypothetical protein n=1 Tax=Leucobacter sp. G161 TaxID=663704 RepID=UPI00073CBF6E|nr:hypothetical protein [Leucobacter sp. G161]KUF06765.1 hypothetical protein AUL38_10935 [Leucobacter sp. G161]
MSETRAPRGLGDGGKRLWRSVTGEFDLAEHELAQLEQACRVRDRIGDLDGLVSDEGLMLASSQGARLHPAVAEARQQRLALARLLVTLGVPDANDDLPAAGKARGVYGGKR